MADVMRLDKYLGEIGVGTRSQIKEAAKRGRITVNGTVVGKADLKVDTRKDTVCLDGQELTYVKFEYIMLNKPQGVISATEDGKHRTVLDLLTDAVRKDLFPVGRLDIDTEGLLILTNDGALAHRMLSPKHHIPKTYYLKVDKEIPDTAVSMFKEGFQVDEELKAMPSELKILTPFSAYLTIEEGKFHQVKRMMKAVGCEVIYLKRISMGGLKLDEGLKPGEYRNLTEKEIALMATRSEELYETNV